MSVHNDRRLQVSHIIIELFEGKHLSQLKILQSQIAITVENLEKEAEIAEMRQDLEESRAMILENGNGDSVLP